jgi:hypothetical protein
MSIGNLKDTGNQGNNLPYQWKVLQGLQAILDEVSLPLTCVDEVTVCGTTFTSGSLNTRVTNGAGVNAVNIQDGNNSITVDGGTGLARTPGVLRPTGVTAIGNVNTVAPAGFFSVSVANVGAANGTVLASLTTIKPGEVLNFSADAINNYFTSFAYDATGTEFIIIYVA